MASTQGRTAAVMSNEEKKMREQLHALAEANRQAAKSGHQQELRVSQKALAEQLNKFYATSPYLSHLDLTGINLNGYREPIRCRLDTAWFQGADLTQVDFTLSQFEYSNFTGATLDRTVMTQTRLERCFFDKAIIDDANFRRATLRHCTMSSVVFRRYPQVKEANMEGTHVSQIFLDYLMSLDDYDRPTRLPKVRIGPTEADD